MKRAFLRAWEKTVRRHGDARAMVQAGSGETVSFNELDARSKAWIAVHVGARDLRRRAVVFAVPNGIAWLEIFIGLVRAGAVIVPMDAGEPIAAQREMAQAMCAGFWWDGSALIELPNPKRFFPEVGLIKLTSGSTGKPKVLEFSDAQSLADGKVVMSTMGITMRDLNYALIPFGHSYGLANLVTPLIAQGVPVVVGTSPLPHAMAEDFKKWAPTVFPSVPTIWRAFVAADVKLDSLRLAVSAGAVLPVEVAREFEARFGRRLHNFYGSSETGAIAFDRTGAATLAGSVGKAVRGVTLRLLRGQRLFVSGPAVITRGNRRRVHDDGGCVMPDRAEIDARGNVTLLGRRGRTVKISGRRVNLEEVAALLRAVPGVREAWVSATAEGVLGAAVAADCTTGDLRAALHGKVAAWKIPKRLLVLKEFPLTERGKIDSASLRTRVFGGA